MGPTDTHERMFSRGAAVFFFFLTFVVLVRFLGPEQSLHIDTSAHVSSNIADPAVLPTFEQGIMPHPSIDHIATPQPLRAIYLTGWSAGTPSRLSKALKLFDDSVLNAVVIDIKDATGRLSYQPQDPELVSIGVGTNRIASLSRVIQAFHDRGIYVIGRIAVFQDPYFAERYPEEAFVDTRTGDIWRDYKGIAWLRPDSTRVREYVARIARDAHAQGFDEINVDYVRFPSDGELKYLDTSGFTTSRAETMRSFFEALHTDLTGIPLSADVFGLTMSARDDVGIGQKAELIAPYVDALAPMVYPSHFWNGTYGIAVPAQQPYEVIKRSLSDGIAKLEAVGVDKRKLRPWLQDFDLLGISYTSDMVRAQTDAAAELGIASWMMWDPANTYTPEVYKKIRNN